MTPEQRMHQKILRAPNLKDFTELLTQFQCKRCTLSKRQNRGIVVYKGSLDAKIMLIGEAPGKEEDLQGIAFCGPAGILQDEIFAAANISTTQDMYLGNICKCRPTAPKGSGKQNTTPKTKQTALCKPYILKEIELLAPQIIVAVGKTAAISLFGFEEKTLMKHIVGRFFQKPTIFGQTELFTIYHPAAILHASGDRETELKRELWEQVKKIKTRVDELGITLTGV